MIIYKATKTQFRKDVNNNIIDRKVLDAFKDKLGHGTAQSEIDSWRNSLPYVSSILEDTDIPNDTGVAIEYHLPRSSKRLDVVLTGLDEAKQNSMVIIELKQWSKATKTSVPDVVDTFVGKTVRDRPHPSYQAWSYAMYFNYFNSGVEKYSIKVNSCAYLHNCYEGKDLLDPFYKDCLERSPLFLRDNFQEIKSYVKEHIRFGDTNDIMGLVENSEIRPSKKLSESLSKMLKGNQEFVMLDDQKVIYEKVVSKTLNKSKGQKTVFIINGGPGTGKSVVAVNLLVRLIKEGLNAQYVSKNAAPRKVYSEKLAGAMTQSLYNSLFVGSGSFFNTKKNAYDALIVDEAHRLVEKSGMYSNLGENQIKEIMNASNISIFFLDEDQRISISDIGSREEILKQAKILGADVIEENLSSQFRCNGSDGYLAWLDHHLQIRDTANYDIKDLDYEVRVFDDAYKMHKEITNLNSKGLSSRTVAGYCWLWASKQDPSKYDIKIGKLKMRWNLTSYGNLWITNPKSITEAGCIHTCQGLEVDYIGVIIGPDFLIRNGSVKTDVLTRSRHDKTIKGVKGLLKKDPDAARKTADRIIKNTYKTLMTRGMKGCFIYCTDEETNEYFKGIVGQK